MKAVLDVPYMVRTRDYYRGKASPAAAFEGVRRPANTTAAWTGAATREWGQSKSRVLH